MAEEESREGARPGSGRVAAAATVFSTGAFLAFFLTAFTPLGPRSWPLVVGLRILWHVGGACWLGWEAGRLGGARVGGRALAALGVGLVGAALSFNPLLDVCVEGGPVELRGVVVVAVDERRPLSSSPTGYGSRALFMELELRDPGGGTHTISAAGLQASRWRWALDELREQGWRPDQPVDVTALVHLGILIDVSRDAAAPD